MSSHTPDRSQSVVEVMRQVVSVLQDEDGRVTLLQIVSAVLVAIFVPVAFGLEARFVMTAIPVFAFGVLLYVGAKAEKEEDR